MRTHNGATPQSPLLVGRVQFAGVRIVGMATSNLPAPVLQPIADDKNLLTVIDSSASSCCGDGCCSV